MKTAVPVMDAVAAALTAHMPAQTEAFRVLHPTEPLPDIAQVYQEEYDYDQLFNLPALILFEDDPVIEEETGGSLFFQLPIDIVAYDVVNADGLEALHRRLKFYRGLVCETFLTYHTSDPSWYGVSIGGYGATGMVKSQQGLARALGVRLVFRIEEQY